MIKGIAVFLSLTLTAISLGELKTPSSAIAEEALYERYLSHIDQNKSVLNLETPFHSQIYMDALWDSVVAYDRKLNLQYAESVYGRLLPADQIRFEVLKSDQKEFGLSMGLLKKLKELEDRRELSVRAKLILIDFREKILNGEMLWAHLDRKLLQDFSAQKKKRETFRVKTSAELRDLFFNTPDAVQFSGSEYKDAVRLYMFCRYSRKYKCVLMMTDKDGKPTLEADGVTPWHHPSLGMSRKRLPSWKRNGNTPEGVYRVDGVMPEASKPKVFGKYRRLILDFIPPSENETLQKTFLPESARDKIWWKSGVVARDIGRDLLRIHGTGMKRVKKNDPFYPLRPTAGCIMQRELEFDGVEYHDQRKLLDKMMSTQGLDPVFANETKIKGLLYLIEIDQQKKAVSLEEMRRHLEI